MADRPRVVIFQASWALQCHTMNLAEALANSGHRVDVFLYDVDSSLVDVAAFAHPRMTVHQWSRVGVPEAPGGREISARTRINGAPQMARFVARLRGIARRQTDEWREWWRLYSGSRRGLIPHSVLAESIASVRSATCIALVGVEKRGLIWADAVSQATGVPFAYYSLELYTRDHPNATYSMQAKRAKRLEARAHRAASATIIQDENRARVLLADNDIDDARLVFLPVSVPGPQRPSRTRFLQEYLHLDDGSQVVLQLGGIRRERLSLELVRAAQSFPPACVLVMHGEGQPSVLQAVKAADASNRVVLSTELVSDSGLPDLIASADVGLVFYGASNMNDILTAHSSEKLALFLRAGLPVVAFAYPGYELIRKHRCGVLIDDLSELPSAVSTILADWQAFSAGALRCFSDHYDFNELVRPVIRALENLGDVRK